MKREYRAHAGENPEKVGADSLHVSFLENISTTEEITH